MLLFRGSLKSFQRMIFRISIQMSWNNLDGTGSFRVGPWYSEVLSSKCLFSLQNHGAACQLNTIQKNLRCEMIRFPHSPVFAGGPFQKGSYPSLKEITKWRFERTFSALFWKVFLFCLCLQKYTQIDSLSLTNIQKFHISPEFPHIH